MERLTFVCLHCQRAFRLSQRQSCPFCSAQLYRVDDVPPKSKPQQWEALRRRILKWETSFDREVTGRVNSVIRREYELERQLGWSQSPKGTRRLTKAKRKAQQHRKKLAGSLEKLR